MGQSCSCGAGKIAQGSDKVPQSMDNLGRFRAVGVVVGRRCTNERCSKWVVCIVRLASDWPSRGGMVEFRQQVPQSKGSGVVIAGNVTRCQGLGE